MNKLQDLFIVLQNAKRNIQTIHWHVTGLNFDVYHKEITDGLIDTISEDVDGVAEYLIRYGHAIPTSVEEVTLAIKYELPSYPSEFINERTAAFKIDDCLKYIFEAIREALDEAEKCDGECRDIVNYLEGLLDNYSKEYKFFSKARLKEID